MTGFSARVVPGFILPLITFYSLPLPCFFLFPRKSRTGRPENVLRPPSSNPFRLRSTDRTRSRREWTLEPSGPSLSSIGLTGTRISLPRTRSRGNGDKFRGGVPGSGDPVLSGDDCRNGDDPQPHPKTNTLVVPQLPSVPGPVWARWKGPRPFWVSDGSRTSVGGCQGGLGFPIPRYRSTVRGLGTRYGGRVTYDLIGFSVLSPGPPLPPRRNP